MFWTIVICKSIVKIPLNIDMVEFQKHNIQETNNICKNIKGSPSGVKAKPWSPVVCFHLGSMCLTWRQEIWEQAFMSYLVSGVTKFDIKTCYRSCLKSCARHTTSELAAGMIKHVHTCLNSRRTYRCRPSGGAGPMYGIFSCPVSHISASRYKLKMSKAVSLNFTC